MSKVTIRTDPETDSALAELRRDGRSKSDVIRAAGLLPSRGGVAARRRAAAEAAAADPADIAEIRAIREEMDRDSAW